MTNEVVSAGKWKPIQLSRDGPKLSHLFFTDDLTLFAEASIEQMEMIKECLNAFTSASGQRVNFVKSQIFFSPDVEDRLAIKLETISGRRYLGINAIHGRVTKKVCTLVSCTESQPDLRDGNQDSSVLQVEKFLLIDALQTNLLPKGICHKIYVDSNGLFFGMISAQSLASVRYKNGHMFIKKHNI